MKNIPYIVGLTGGIGSGKSEATVILEALGAYIIDADRVSHEISKPNEVGYNALKDAFPDFVDNQGRLMRSQLREHIFSKNLTPTLNKIMLPLIKTQIENLILSAETDLVFLVAPLLFESGMNKICDVVITIACDTKMRIERIMARDNISEQLIKSMIDSQLGDCERKKLSDIVIENNGDKDALSRKVKFYYEKIKNNLQEDN